MRSLYFISMGASILLSGYFASQVYLSTDKIPQFEDRSSDEAALLPDALELQPAQVIESLPAERIASGIIARNLFESATESGVPAGMIDQIADLLGSRIDFRKDLRAGDSFSVLIGNSPGETGASAQELLGVAIRNRGKLIAAVAKTSAQGRRYYVNEQGAPLENGFLRYPLAFSRITSTFTAARYHPILKVRRPHNGVDFAAPVGTPVRAVADGRIVKAGYHGAAGIMIRVSHGSRYTTEYLHLSRISRGLRVGSSVQKGTVIGAVGITGASTGPHLHFALFDRGRYINPLRMPAADPQTVDSHDIVYAASIVDSLEAHMLQVARDMPETIKIS